MVVWNSMLLKIITILLDVVKQHVRFIVIYFKNTLVILTNSIRASTFVSKYLQQL
jgi:hypothetical protein